MTEKALEQHDSYAAYCSVKLVDLWSEVYLRESKAGHLNPKAAADKAAADFKSFLQGA